MRQIENEDRDRDRQTIRYFLRLKALKHTPLTLIWPFFSKVATSTGIKGLGVKGG